MKMFLATFNLVGQRLVPETRIVLASNSLEAEKAVRKWFASFEHTSFHSLGSLKISEAIQGE